MAPTGRVTLVGDTAFGAGFPVTEGAFRVNYTGGQTDAVVATLDLVLEGVDLLGNSKPACLGPLTMNATEMPMAGASSFGFYCSGAPPLSDGFLVIGLPDDRPEIVLERRIGLGSKVIPARSDASGYVETPFPLPAGSRGLRFAARYVFENGPGCPGNGPRSTSNGLRVTVQ